MILLVFFSFLFFSLYPFFSFGGDELTFEICWKSLVFFKIKLRRANK